MWGDYGATNCKRVAGSYGVVCGNTVASGSGTGGGKKAPWGDTAWCVMATLFSPRPLPGVGRHMAFVDSRILLDVLCW